MLKTKAIENLNSAIAVAIEDGVKLTNIGASDIYEGSEKLINGVRLYTFGNYKRQDPQGLGMQVFI